jgi:hypothetical protein|tara:strand:+ start:2135 stop:3193 length:1059 start_codon:yes stop_codon:yes gene_type:complete
VLPGQDFFTKGQFWAGGLTGDDPPTGQTSFETQLGYIPTLSLSRDLNNYSFIDLEWGYYFERIYNGDALLKTASKNYRMWFRYSSEKLEARLGLQKIAFGPAQILRSLAWFDTIDPKDPTGQTAAVEAFRLRVYPTNSLSVWTWVINNELDTLAYGGRVELSTDHGEWGFTYHQDPTMTTQAAGQLPVIIPGPHQRVALDHRYDGYLGFWFEGAGFFADNQQAVALNRYALVTFGADYTVPVGPGLLVMAEIMQSNGWSSKTDSTSKQTFTAFMAGMPLGMLHQLMFITHVDWDENHTYNYFRWSTTYDNFSLNFVLSINPKRVNYDNVHEGLLNTLTGFGTGLQFMLIYNH